MYARGRNHFGKVFRENEHTFSEQKLLVSLSLIFFKKRLGRPNRPAHMIRIQILCRTSVSMSQELSPGLISIRENSKYSSLARMAAATTSQQLCPPGKSPGVSRAGMKYPVRGNPSLRFMGIHRKWATLICFGV